MVRGWTGDGVDGVEIGWRWDGDAGGESGKMGWRCGGEKMDTLFPSLRLWIGGEPYRETDTCHTHVRAVMAFCCPPPFPSHVLVVCK